MKCKFCQADNVYEENMSGLMNSLEGRKCRFFSRKLLVSCPKCHSTCIKSWTAVDSEGNEYKMYSVAELKAMKPGTCFRHLTLGPCILLRENDKFMMHFKIKEYPVTPVEYDIHPWTIPMRILGA